MIQETTIQDKEKSLELLASNSQLLAPTMYQVITLNSTARLLSLLDRNPYSKTHGSFSRNYWHYKILADSPSSTDQQGVLALSCIYLLNLKSNNFYLNSNLLDPIEASIYYWTKLQSKDGSFSEWYPNEHSHVATAFTSYAISESLLLLKDKINVKILEKATSSLKKSGDWLNKNIDTTALNHTAGAVAALYNIYLLTGEKIYLEVCHKNLNTLIGLQDKEGWFPEYGNADPGYLGVSIDYLAKYWHKSKDPIAEQSLKKALDFLIWFYLENSKTTGGEFGWRNVKYMLPHGLALLSEKFESAKYLESNLRASLKQDLSINPNSVDDRYFLFFHYPNYAQASLLEPKEVDFSSIRPKTFLKIFSSSGLVSCKQENYHLITNLKKEGILKLELRDSILSDCGYFTKIKSSNKILSTQTTSKIEQLETNEELPFTAQIKTNFIELKPTKPASLILFRLFNFTFGKSALFMKFFNNYIKENFIYQTKEFNIPLTLERSIFLDSNKIIIEDQMICEDKKLKLEKLSIEPSLSLMHVPTSKYFHFSDLNSDSDFNPSNLAEPFNKNNKITVKRIVDLNQSKPNIELIVTM